MKLDERFEDIQVEKNVICPDCGYQIIKGSVAHKHKLFGKVYCVSCFKEMRSLD